MLPSLNVVGVKVIPTTTPATGVIISLLHRSNPMFRAIPVPFWVRSPQTAFPVPVFGPNVLAALCNRHFPASGRGAPIVSTLCSGPARFDPVASKPVGHARSGAVEMGCYLRCAFAVPVLGLEPLLVAKFLNPFRSRRARFNACLLKIPRNRAMRYVNQNTDLSNSASVGIQSRQFRDVYVMLQLSLLALVVEPSPYF